MTPPVRCIGNGLPRRSSPSGSARASRTTRLVAQWAKANGLTITQRHPNRVVLDVSGSVADIQKALHVKMQTYQHPKEARTFYAPSTEPSLDLAVPVLHISGLG